MPESDPVNETVKSLAEQCEEDHARENDLLTKMYYEDQGRVSETQGHDQGTRVRGCAPVNAEDAKTVVGIGEGLNKTTM